MERQLHVVRAAVGLYGPDEGIGMNWQWIGLEKEEFKRFLHELLRAMGFRVPEVVAFEANREDGAIDWNRLRIPPDECHVQGVDSRQAVRAGRHYLASEGPQAYGLRFLLGDELEEPQLV